MDGIYIEVVMIFQEFSVPDKLSATHVLCNCVGSVLLLIGSHSDGG